MKHLKYIFTIVLFLMLALPIQASGHGEEGKVDAKEMFVSPGSDVPFIGILHMVKHDFFRVHLSFFSVSTCLNRQGKHQTKDEG